MEAIVFTKDLQDIKLPKLKVSATFECELSKAGLQVEWYKDNKKLRRDENHDIKTDGKTHKLIVNEVTPEESGKYKAVYEKLETEASLILEGNYETLYSKIFLI